MKNPLNELCLEEHVVRDGMHAVGKNIRKLSKVCEDCEDLVYLLRAKVNNGLKKKYPYDNLIPLNDETMKKIFIGAAERFENSLRFWRIGFAAMIYEGLDSGKYAYKIGELKGKFENDLEFYLESVVS
jgi:hypothetical protein